MVNWWQLNLVANAVISVAYAFICLAITVPLVQLLLDLGYDPNERAFAPVSRMGAHLGMEFDTPHPLSDLQSWASAYTATMRLPPSRSNNLRKEIYNAYRTAYEEWLGREAVAAALNAVPEQ